MRRALVLLSGGLDSTVALAYMATEQVCSDVGALNIFYGQRHAKEQACARYQARTWLPKPGHYHEFNLSAVFAEMPTPMTGSGDIPHGAYKEGEIPVTYVPFRNGIMLSVATGLAYSYGYDTVVLAAHLNDEEAAYPDCSSVFLENMHYAINFGTGGKVSLYAPFQNWRKEAIVEEGANLGVDFANTWSCYEGGAKPCGKCGTCIDRRKAFSEAGLIDPLVN